MNKNQRKDCNNQVTTHGGKNNCSLANTCSECNHHCSHLYGNHYSLCKHVEKCHECGHFWPKIPNNHWSICSYLKESKSYDDASKFNHPTSLPNLR